MKPALLILIPLMFTSPLPGQSAPRPGAATRAATTPAMDAAVRDLTDYLERAAKLKEDDIDGRLALARWAFDRKMYEQAADMADQVLYRDPGNRAAYAMLQKVDDAKPLPEEPDTEAALKVDLTRRFQHEFKTRNSKHFIIAYDTTDAFAVQRATSMEKAYDAFQFYFNMSALRPDFLEKRLVVILVKDREDYLAYGRQTQGADLSWSGGFYSQRTNRAIFFDDASGPSAASMVKQQTDLKAQIEDLNKRISQFAAQGQTGMVNTLTVERNRAAESLTHVNNQLTNKALVQNNATTMHEAAHQIAFNMGIQMRQVDYPMWLSEGLACSFEVEDSAGHRGPALINYGRMDGLKQLVKSDKLVPIEKFIAADLPAPTGTTNQDEVTGYYAESWALFHYLYKFERAGTEKYLLAYKAHAPLRQIGAEERKTLFIKAFGDDLEGLNKKFVAYVKALPAKAN